MYRLHVWTARGYFPHVMGLTVENRSHTLRPVGSESHQHTYEAHFMEGAATMQETLCFVHGMYPCDIRPSDWPQCTERSIPQGGKGMIMVVRISYYRWYVSCESPHGMFLVDVLYRGTNHTGTPVSRTGAYIYMLLHIQTPFEACLGSKCLFPPFTPKSTLRSLSPSSSWKRRTASNKLSLASELAAVARSGLRRSCGPPKAP